MSDLAPHLSWAEVLLGSGWASRDDVPPFLALSMVITAERLWTPLREEWGGPLRVVSGLRSPEANLRAGGARASQHLRGTALDLATEDLYDLPRLYDLADVMMEAGEIPKGGLSLYRHGSEMTPGPRRFLHLDARGRLARWSVRCEGRWTSFSQRRLPVA